MARIDYHKLVRDRIPEIIEAEGFACSVRRLTRAAYLRALKDKIGEEASELRRARGRGGVLNELVDLHELVAAARRALGVTAAAFARAVRRKRLARGGFGKRLFLEHTSKRLKD